MSNKLKVATLFVVVCGGARSPPHPFYHPHSILLSYFPMQIEQSCHDVVNNLWRIQNQTHIGYASVRLMESIINAHRVSDRRIGEFDEWGKVLGRRRSLLLIESSAHVW